MNNITLICFDIDDTLIRGNSWRDLHGALGMTPEENKRMYEAYQSGSMTYDEWLAQILVIYKKNGLASKSFIQSTLQHFELVPGARDIVTYLRDGGYTVAIISGSFDILTNAVAEALHVDVRKGNTSLIFDADEMLQDLRSYGDETHAKLLHLQHFCDELRIPLTECACVGDGANDLEMFRATGKGITFRTAPAMVQHEAWKVIDAFSDLKSFL